ncbi:MAG: NAD(P)H-dependent oxidoreductase subunit E, partial [Bacteroidales bacterium]|nr:NAD(P)H-dependent oxidoreductase subunit E [Bacteroidales bacterium]
MKITSSDALERIRQEAARALSVREESDRSAVEESCGLDKGTPHMQILCCGGTGCKASESAKIVENFKASLQEHGIDCKVDVLVPGCFGFCEKGPIVKIIPDNPFYTSVRPSDVEEIVTSHIIAGERVERLLYQDPGTGRHISDSKHMNFYRKQLRIALRNCGFIDPENILEYIARDGYKALSESLRREPLAVLADIKASGLRG